MSFIKPSLLVFQVVFGTIVLLMLWLPIRIIKLLLPAFLPYNVMLYRWGSNARPIIELHTEWLLGDLWKWYSPLSCELLIWLFNVLSIDPCLCSDAPVSELSLELLLLQVVLPALLEQGHTRQWLKGLVRAWTLTTGYLL